MYGTTKKTKGLKRFGSIARSASAVGTLYAFPLLAFATDTQDIGWFLGKISGLLDSVVPFIVGLAVFVIIWGIFTYITQASNEEKREEAKKYILWGVVGVFMMLSVWGFVNILLNTFSLDNQIDSDTIPKVPELDGGTE